MLKKILSNFAYFAVMFAVGFGIYYYFLNPAQQLNNASTNNSKLSSQMLFAANLPNENGVKQALNQYQGKIIVLNFWATWCPPCREEMPELSQLNTTYKNKNLVVLGIAIDELKLVKEFNQATPVSYPLFVAENEGMALSNQLGNDKGVLPYTVIIDTHGKIVKTFFGRITKPLLESTITALVSP